MNIDKLNNINDKYLSYTNNENNGIIDLQKFNFKKSSYSNKSSKEKIKPILKTSQSNTKRNNSNLKLSPVNLNETKLNNDIDKKLISFKYSSSIVSRNSSVNNKNQIEFGSKYSNNLNESNLKSFQTERRNVLSNNTINNTISNKNISIIKKNIIQNINNTNNSINVYDKYLEKAKCIDNYNKSYIYCYKGAVNMLNIPNISNLNSNNDRNKDYISSSNNLKLSNEKKSIYKKINQKLRNQSLNCNVSNKYIKVMIPSENKHIENTNTIDNLNHMTISSRVDINNLKTKQFNSSISKQKTIKKDTTINIKNSKTDYNENNSNLNELIKAKNYNYKDIVDKVNNLHNLHSKKLEYKEKQKLLNDKYKEIKELEECTFFPKITKKHNDINKSMNKNNSNTLNYSVNKLEESNNSTNTRYINNNNNNILSNIYEKNITWLNKKAKKIEQEQHLKESQINKECTFTPLINDAPLFNQNGVDLDDRYRHDIDKHKERMLLAESKRVEGYSKCNPDYIKSYDFNHYVINKNTNFFTSKYNKIESDELLNNIDYNNLSKHNTMNEEEFYDIIYNELLQADLEIRL